jgi:hypothetical protein
MFRTSYFQLSLLSMAALAASSDIDQLEKKNFVNFAVMYGKMYKSVGEMEERL